MIIGICGSKGHGKDTCGDYFVKNYGFIKYNFADPIKDISKILFNLNKDQLYGNKKEIIDKRYNMSPREIYQKLGTEFGQSIIYKLFPNLNRDKIIWLELCKQFIENQNSIGNNNIVICDVRFKHEIDFIKSLNGKIIKVKKDIENKDKHISETQINNYDNDIDYFIENNNNIEDLYNKLYSFYKDKIE